MNQVTLLTSIALLQSIRKLLLGVKVDGIEISDLVMVTWSFEMIESFGHEHPMVAGLFLSLSQLTRCYLIDNLAHDPIKLLYG